MPPASPTRSDDTVSRLLVVGGSVGIGHAVALDAARRGHDVVVAARRTVDDLPSITLDVRDEAAVAEELAKLDALDAVVYAAGIAQLSPLSEQSADDWRATLETNLVGAALVARHTVPLLEKSNGVMVVCSSTTDDEHRWGLGAYGVSKAALNRLIDGLRAEHPGVRFTRATLGPTDGTEFANGWDMSVLTDAFNRWVERGQQSTEVMSLAGLASVIVQLIDVLLAQSDVSMPVVYLEPPGGPLEGHSGRK